MDFLTDLNQWISNHLQLVSVLGVPLLTLCVTYIINRSVERRSAEERRVERDLAREMKLAEFRESWIQELRHEMASFLAVQVGKGVSWEAEDVRQANTALANIVLRMNPDDQNYVSLIEVMTHLVDTKVEEQEQVIQNSQYVTDLCQDILKTEWERLKADLRETEIVQAKT